MIVALSLVTYLVLNNWIVSVNGVCCSLLLFLSQFYYSVAGIVTKYHYNYQANITSKHKTTIGQELEENWTIAHDLFEDVNGAWV